MLVELPKKIRTILVILLKFINIIQGGLKRDTQNTYTVQQNGYLPTFSLFKFEIHSIQTSTFYRK